MRMGFGVIELIVVMQRGYCGNGARSRSTLSTTWADGRVRKKGVLQDIRVATSKRDAHLLYGTGSASLMDVVNSEVWGSGVICKRSELRRLGASETWSAQL
jgi:hypothetical protein